MTSVPFNVFMMIIIILNAVLMAVYSTKESREESDNDAITENIIVIIFTIEVVLKMIGLGFRNWAKDRMNLFDAFIVVVSLTHYIFIAYYGSK